MEFLGIDLSAMDIRVWWGQFVEYAGPRWAPSLGVLVLAVVAYCIGRPVLTRVENRWVTKTDTKLDDYVIRLVRKAFVISTLAWATWRLFSVWGLPGVAEWVLAIWIALLFIPLSRFVGDVMAVLESQVVQRTETTLDDTALPLLNTVVRFLVVATGVVLALDRIGLNIAPLLAGAGVMGLALSLAAKDTLSNLIAGVLLIIDRPFQVGDRIELWLTPNETGSWGDVIEIGLRATKIRNPDNLVVVVPNNEIMRRDIINYTMSGAHIRLRLPFDVAYDSDIERAKKILIELASKTEGVKMDPAPIVIVRDFGPSEVKLQLRVWIEDARARRAIGDQIKEAAMSAFSEAGVEIPYPKRDVFVRRMDEPVTAGD